MVFQNYIFKNIFAQNFNLSECIYDSSESLVVIFSITIFKILSVCKEKSTYDNTKIKLFNLDEKQKWHGGLI